MSRPARFQPAAGIAIGAILFVVAILAVLMGAISAGSGGFGSNISSESHRTMGGALVQQGVTLSVGFQRLLTGGVEPDQIIVTDTYSTPNAMRALYSPIGGGIQPAFPPRDATVTGATWRYVIDANMRDFGVAGNNDVITLVQIRNDGICRSINSVVIGYNAPFAITLAVLPGTVVGADVAGPDGLMDVNNSFDTSAVASLAGIRQACVRDAGGSFWYYHVIKAN